MGGNKMKVKARIKKLVALIVAIILCFPTVPIGARAANEGEYDWRLQSFGGDQDLTLSDKILIPGVSVNGFTLDYGKLLQENSGSVVVYNAKADTLQNSIWEFNMKMSGVLESTGRYRIALFPRFIDGRNCDGIAIDGSSQLQHSYRVNGSEGWPGISNLTGISFKADQVYAIKLMTLDNKITMYVDGVKVAETDTRSEITEGKYGFRIWGPEGDSSEKKFEVTDISFKELKNSFVNAADMTVLARDWGTKDIAIPITLGAGDEVVSVKNNDIELVNETDYVKEADKILIKKEYIASQEGSFNLDIAFEGGMFGSFRIRKYDLENQVEYIWEAEDGIDAWEKISGGGTFEMEEDGLRLIGENKLLAADAPITDAGEIEITFDQKNDNGRMGFLFRADKDGGTWQSILHDDDYEYSTWYYKNSAGARNGFHGDGTFLFSRVGLVDTKLKLRYRNNVVTMWMDDYMMYSGDVSGLTDGEGIIGISTEKVSDILLKKVVYRSLPENYLPEDTEGSKTIEKGDLTVSVAGDFPRVIDYTLNGKTLYGSEFKNNMVTINAVDYPAQATVAEQSAEKIVYEVVCEKINVTFEVAYTVLDGNVLDMRIQNIDDSQFEVRSLGFPNQPLLSANSAQSNAKLDATVPTDGRSSYNINGLTEHHLNIKDEKIAYDRDVLVTLPFITTDGLSGSMINNVLLNLKEFRYRAYKKEDGTITAGYENNDFMYRGLDGDRMFADEDLYCQIVITEDTNEDGAMDWQDGANALKTINKDKINGGDKIADSFVHVGYNFASQVQHPFLKVADNMKRISNYIDGFDQVLVFKGYANEGHDSAHADFDDINKRAGGAEDMQKAAEILENINSVMGIHINHSEAYPEAKMFQEDVMSTYNAWAWLDQSKAIRRDVDILKGGMDNRLNSMFDKVPGIGFVYVDTYGDDRWAEARMAKNLVGDHNVILGTENKTDFDRFASWVHWPGIGDSMHRFVYHQQKDVYNGSNIFRGGYSRSMSFMSWQHNNNINSAVEQFYGEQLAQRYLMNHDVRKWTSDEAIFEGNVRSTSDNKIYKDGNLVADGKLIFISWFAEDSETKNPDEAAKIYHWNPSGGESTWTLPDSWQTQSTVKLYQPNQNGKEFIEEINVTDGGITINADAKTPYVIYKGNENVAANTTQWSEGSPIEDTSFNSRDFSIWKASSTSASTDHIKIEDNTQGIALLTVVGEEDGKVSQTMENLIPGQKYRLSVWAGAENGKTARLIVDTPDGKTYENYTENTPMVCRNLDTYAQDKKVQRVWVDFVQPEGETTAVVTLSADTSGSNGKATFMETRIVKTNAPELPDNYVAWEDFEHVDQGFGIFAPESREESSHLSETHLPYTEDTINGDWSLKKGSVMRTQPSTARMKPNTEYYLEFEAIKSGKVYVQSESDGSRVLEEAFADGKNEFTFVTGSQKDYIVRLESGWIIDDFKIYFVDDPTPPTIPGNVTAIMTEEGTIEVKWNPSVDEDSRVTGYNVYRDGVNVANVADTVYIDKDMTEYTTYNYQISAVNAGNTESERSKAVKGYYGTEMTSLIPESVILKGTDTVEVRFNRALHSETAEISENYHISDGVTVSKAELLKDGKTVSLTIAGMPMDKPVFLTVTGVKDTSKAGVECNGDYPLIISVLARYYKFDEDSTGTAYDFIGIEDGMKTNVGVDESGYIGKAAFFSGNSRVQLSKDSLHNVKEWTLSTWIKWDGNSSESQTIMGNGISGVSSASGMWFHIRTDQKLWASPWANGTGKDIKSAESVPVGEWTHVAILFNSDEEFVMYMNGTEVGRVKFAGYPTNIENFINIGCNINGSGSIIHRFRGAIDELKIYQAALSAEQIKTEAEREEFLPSVIGDRYMFNKDSDNDLKVKVEENGYQLAKVTIGESVIDTASYELENTMLTIRGAALKAFLDGLYKLNLTFGREGEDPQVASADLIVVTKQKPVNKSELYRLISLSGDLSEAIYTKESWDALQAVLKDASDIFTRKDVTQPQVDEQAAVLGKIMEDMVGSSGQGERETLKAAIAGAKSYPADYYSETSYAALQEAIEEATAVATDTTSTKEAIAEQIGKLEQAIAGLEDIRADKHVLTALYEAVKNMELNSYTEESVNRLEVALAQAKSILDKEAATKAETAQAEAGLLTALSGLEKKQSDIDTLKAAIAGAKSYPADYYSETSYAALQKAIEEAAAVAENKTATKEAITEQIEKLVQAVAGLEDIRADKHALTALYEAVKNIDLSSYTEESVNRLEDALVQAKDILDKSTATKAEAAQTEAGLLTALAGLEKKAAVVKTDLSLAIAIYEAYKDLDTEKYTKESAKVFKDALEAVNAIIGNADAAQGDVDAAVASLISSATALEYEAEEPQVPVVPVNTQILRVYYQTYASLDMAPYSTASAAKLQSALQTAAKVLNDPNATQEKVDSMATILMKAALGLEIKASTKVLKKGEVITYKGLKYKVTNAATGKAAVSVTGASKKTSKSIIIPAVVTLKGIKCKVTGIGAKAFYKFKSLTKIKIGSNVIIIGKQAFYGDAKLKKIIVKTKKLNQIGGQAFKGISSNATIRVPSSMKKKYQKRFKNKGLKSTVRIK